MRAGSLVVWVAYRGQGRRSRNRERSRKEEWGEEWARRMAPFFSPALPARGCGFAALARPAIRYPKTTIEPVRKLICRTFNTALLKI